MMGGICNGNREAGLVWIAVYLRLKRQKAIRKAKTLQREMGRTRRLSWTGQSRAAFERQYLTDSFYL